MNLILETSVEQGYLDVKSGFTETLFKKLSPPFPPVKVLRFDGCNTGDQVILELNFLLFKQRWTSIITEDRTTDLEFSFVDEGVELPFFLKKWKHRHRVISTGIQSKIRDEITFEAPISLFNFLLYPVLWMQFAYRKRIYQEFFSRAEGT
jgi:ligand-binding SRPBCC domain-containing protein